MNYEEKYKQALERARQFSEHPLLEDSATIVEYIFPELAESEDERIKEEIVAYINELADLKNEKIPTKWLAWLEKQDEQPTDKVDTKFNVGDWISGYYTNYKVMAINSKGYVVEDTDGNKINILFENEKFHHLFIIADAKDGDVLVSGDVIFIFNKIHGLWVNCYCSWHKDGSFWEENEDLMHIKYAETIHPTTKEQRGLLFQKMKEAGYEWDAERKELKKIEVASKESENERMKIAIMHVLYENYTDAAVIEGVEIAEIIAWLEKQGKQKTLDPDTVYKLTDKGKEVAKILDAHPDMTLDEASAIVDKKEAGKTVIGTGLKCATCKHDDEGCVKLDVAGIGTMCLGDTASIEQTTKNENNE